MRYVSSIHYAGYTLVELLVVITVIGILATIVVSSLQGSQARARDTERVTDIDNLRSRLEEYYNDRGGYPNTFSASTFPGLDPLVLKDANNTSIVIHSPVASQVAAQAAATPSSNANYIYVPYPTGCGAITCTGYVLKTYIEQPTNKIPNPYARYGLNNN